MYDAVLLVSFGGPERPEDVLPFLENVTRGRGIPRERLEQVAQHYHRFGGRSPINDQNRALLAALRAEFRAAGPDLPLYWGNRNWHPLLADTLREMRDDGVRRAVAVFTSAFSSYAGCRQYREDLAAAQAKLGDGAPQVHKVRQFFDHPGFVEPLAEGLRAALSQVGGGARVLFSAHSIPTVMAETSGPAGGAYVAQLRESSRLVAERAGISEWELVFQSRSGPPAQPWLEPDVAERVAGLAGEGCAAVVVVPVGFVSDHMEVRYDLDQVARQRATELGMRFVRVPTVGTDPRFVAALRELVLEVVEGWPPVQRAALSPLGPWHGDCPAACCPAPVPRPAAAEVAR